MGDEGNMCWTTACDNGIRGACPGGETEGAFRKVVCEPAKVRPASAALNVVIEGDETVGQWGGTCSCPDGEVYLAGAYLVGAHCSPHSSPHASQGSGSSMNCTVRRLALC